MSDQATEPDMRLSRHATEIVAAYVSNNGVSPLELPSLIESVRSTLACFSSIGATPGEPETQKLTAAQIKKSITPDALISFIDGKPYQTLKRHLTANGLDPSSYRIQYGLPADYPMVAPAYRAMRAEISRKRHAGTYERS